eukprot:5186223-Prymnesium_polylepis.1
MHATHAARPCRTQRARAARSTPARPTVRAARWRLAGAPVRGSAAGRVGRLHVGGAPLRL